MRPRGENIEYDKLRDRYEAAQREITECRRMIALDTETVNSLTAKVSELEGSQVNRRIKDLVARLESAEAAVAGSCIVVAEVKDRMRADIAVVEKKWVDTADAYKDVLAIALKGLAVVEDFMPNIKNCALQDYKRLNEFLMDAQRLKNTSWRPTHVSLGETGDPGCGIVLSYTCPRCGAVSYNRNDIAQRYCGRCHKFETNQREHRHGPHPRRYA